MKLNNPNAELDQSSSAPTSQLIQRVTHMIDRASAEEIRDSMIQMGLTDPYGQFLAYHAAKTNLVMYERYPL